MLKRTFLTSLTFLTIFISGALAATYTVTNCADAGAGSLRQAIINANDASGADIIEFNIPNTDSGYTTEAGVSFWRIKPTSVLPPLTDDYTVINGATQTTNRGNTNPAGPEIEINGSSAGSGFNLHGFEIRAANCTIQNLVINRFDKNGITLYGTGAKDCAIVGNYIGTDVRGLADLGNGSNGVSIGYYIGIGPQSNVIEGNVISGNNGNGVDISGADTNSNEVKSNYIGTAAGGTASLENDQYGVFITNGAQFNCIGVGTEAGRNIISGNKICGVFITGSNTNSNQVKGNYIGTDVNGTADLGNTWSGIEIRSGAQSNRIGGTSEAERNVISGNNDQGIAIIGANSNEVMGNYIGVNASGSAGLGNSTGGIYISGEAQYNLIGEAGSFRNIISGNNQVGVYLRQSHRNEVKGNYIGTDKNGTAALGNSGGGLWITAGAQWNGIYSNLISANPYGIMFDGSNTKYNMVHSNYVGTTATGEGDLGNDGNGILISAEAQSNRMGYNIIAYNGSQALPFHGVVIGGAATLYNTITQNSMFYNYDKGILLYDGGNSNLAYPIITSAVYDPSTGQTAVTGTASGNPLLSVEVFVADSTTGYGEGKTYKGAAKPDSSGNWSLTVTGVTTADALTSTTTDVYGNTSEFSQNVSVVLASATTTSTTTTTTIAGATTTTGSVTTTTQPGATTTVTTTTTLTTTTTTTTFPVTISITETPGQAGAILNLNFQAKSEGTATLVLLESGPQPKVLIKRELPAVKAGSNSLLISLISDSGVSIPSGTYQLKIIYHETNEVVSRKFIVP